MKQFVTKLRSKPEETRKKIFFSTMIGLSFMVFSFYVFSISRSVIVVVDQEKKNSQGSLLGEFSLPSIKDSVGANVKDIMQKVNGK